MTAPAELAKPFDSSTNSTEAGHLWSTELIEVYADRFDAFVGLAKRIVGDHSLAEEIVQETFLTYQRKQPCHAPDRMVPYLRSMVRNAAVSSVRRETRRRELLEQTTRCLSSTADSIEDVVIRRLTSELLQTRIRRLPPRQSQVVQCRLGGLSVEQTAEALAISCGSVKTHRFRAAAALRETAEPLEAA